MSTWLDELFARREGKQASEVAVDSTSWSGPLTATLSVQEALDRVDELRPVEEGDLLDAGGSIVIGHIARHTGNLKIGNGAGESFNHHQSTLTVLVGDGAGRLDERASYSTALGAQSSLGWASGSIEHRTAIGCYAACIADNSVRLGRAGSDVVYGGTYNTDSDERFKAQILQIGSEFGIDLIEALRPVTFEIQGREGVTHFGFIAQEVAGALAAAGVGPNGIHSVGGVDPNLGFAPESINYSALIAPLVQAVQELAERVRVLEMEKHNG